MKFVFEELKRSQVPGAFALSGAGIREELTPVFSDRPEGKNDRLLIFFMLPPKKTL